MKVYISGKITGLDTKKAKAKFKKAEKLLKAFDYEGINPMVEVEQKDDWTWKQYMQADINLLFECDAIYMLNNWGDSKGAKFEYDVAKHLGLNFFYEQ